MGGGGGLLGGVTDAIGLTDYDGAEEQQAKALDAQTQANQDALAVTKENLKFQREQHQDWKNVFGDLQENLKEYYDRLDGSSTTAERIRVLNTELNKATKDTTQALTQRGLGTSGAMGQAISNINYQGAQQRATIRGMQEQDAINQKLGFLSLGLGQGTAYAGLVGQAATSQASTGLQGGTALAGLYQAQGAQSMANNYNVTNSLFTKPASDMIGSVSKGYVTGLIGG